MEEKTIPWWRRVLQYALDEFRSGFGFFPRSARPFSQEEDSSLYRSEESLEEDTALSPEPANPETLAAEPAKPPEPLAGAIVAVASPPPPAPKSAAKRNPAEEPAAAAEPEAAPEPIIAPPSEAAVQIEVQPAAPVDLVDPAPAIEPVPALLPVAALPADSVVELSPTSEAGSPPEPVSQPASEQAPGRKSAPKAPIKLETRDNEADLSPFSVVVEQVYDGPLDLLLDLIRKQDIDIYDIPIARITAQFLAYVNRLKASDVDVAGEFIYIASLLIHIKSKMLLPRAPAGGPEEAAEDPRRELVERLLEHERFKNAAQMLQQKQMLEAATWTNPGLREFQENGAVEPEIAADTVDLVRVFRDILERARNRPIIDVEEDAVTVGQMIHFLARRLTLEDKPVALRRLLSHTRSERALIAMFLALLELVRLQAVLLRQDRQFSEIFIKKHIGFDALMNEGLASARDDWR